MTWVKRLDQRPSAPYFYPEVVDFPDRVAVMNGFTALAGLICPGKRVVRPAADLCAEVLRTCGRPLPQMRQHRPRTGFRQDGDGCALAVPVPAPVPDEKPRAIYSQRVPEASRPAHVEGSLSGGSLPWSARHR